MIVYTLCNLFQRMSKTFLDVQHEETFLNLLSSDLHIFLIALANISSWVCRRGPLLAEGENYTFFDKDLILEWSTQRQ